MKKKHKIKIQIGMGPSPNKPGKAEGPGKVKKVDHSVHLLPPPSDACQECAVDHRPDEPHNKDSMFYQMAFRKEHGRWPTWADAIAHCSDDAKVAIKEMLEKEGLWSEPIDGLSEEEKAARAIGSLPTHSIEPDGGAYFTEVIEVEDKDEEEDGAI